MKHLSKLLAAIMVVSMIVTALAVFPAALDSGDWEVVHHESGTPASVNLEKTVDNGIRLSHEGHYPSSNAGLLYTKPLSLKDGITLTVTVETNADGSSDAWYGFWLLNKPLYFDYANKNGGHGIVLLCRPGGNHEWHIIDESGFRMLTSTYPTADKEYYDDAGVTITYEIKDIDGVLAVSVDGEPIEDDIYSGLLPDFENGEAYIGFSMSQTELKYQSFVVNSLNGEAPATTGDAIPMEQGSTTKPADTTADPNVPNWEDPDLKSFTLIDFTNPENVVNLTGNDCKLSFDEAEAALKIEVTGPDPFVNIPMKKAWYFDGDDFCIVKMEYKTDFEGEGSFYYTTKEVPSMELCSLMIDIEATEGEYKILEYDMQESSNWTGQIRNFRFDPAAEGEEGQVFYVKNINFEKWEEPETDPSQNTTKEPATEPEDSEPIGTEKTDDTTGSNATGTEKSGTETKSTGEKGKSNVGLIIGIAAGVVVVAAAVACGIILSKKKKA